MFSDIWSQCYFDHSDYDYEYKHDKEDQSSHYLDKIVSDHTDGDIDDRDEYSESSVSIQTIVFINMVS